jgi:hypothetical protein
MVGTGRAGEGAAATSAGSNGRLSRGHAGTAIPLFAVAMAIRLGTFLRTAVIFNDGPVFLGIAEQMDAGRWAEAFAQDQHPLYPLLIVAAQSVQSTPFAAATAVSLLFGSLAVVALYAFLVQAWDRRIAVVGALLLAVNPYAARFSADVQSEPVYLFFFLGAVAALFGALRACAVRWAVVAGVFAGLAYLTRPEGIGVVLVGASLAGVAWLRGSWTARRAALWLGGLAAGAAVMAAPYLWVVRAESGSLRLSQKKSLLAILGVHGPGGPGGGLASAGEDITGIPIAWVIGAVVAVGLLVVLARVRGTAAVRVRVGPLALAAAVVAGAVAAAVAAPEAFGVFAGVVVSTIRPEVLVLVVMGVSVAASRPPSGRTLFITLTVGLYMAVLFGLLLAYGYVSRRHALPPLALLLGYAARGAWILVDALAARLGGRGLLPSRARAIAVAVVVGIVVGIALPKTWHDHRGEEVAARIAAEWVGDHAPPGAALASSRLKHGWYADRRWVPLYDGGEAKSLARLVQEGVRFVIVDDRARDPRAWPVADVNAGVRPGLASRYSVEHAGRVAEVFELLPGGA